MIISVIDTHGPAGMPDLVRQLDGLGYHRYWTTEHHAPGQSASPTVLAAVAASLSSRLRVGTGGVMLRYQAPARVAADFSLLASLFPGRVDVGVIGNGVTAVEMDTALLDGRDAAEGFPARVRQLARVLTRNATPTAGGSGATPGSAAELWVCGVSIETATLAAEIGAGFAYGAYMAQFTRSGMTPDAMSAYKNAFRPVGAFAEPRTLISCFGSCAESMTAARQMWAALEPATPSFIGSVSECSEQLEALAERLRSPEVMIQCFAPAEKDRLAAYSLLADALIRD